ncbi:hypothetical protein L3V86_02515 [Thiotrichales bacterium 19S11-10]|nr:hypothetical protein [Thiotrichales bacterium 19S11-10]
MPLKFPLNSCYGCGLIQHTYKTYCEQCLISPPPWNRLFISYQYQGLIEKIFQQFKFKANFKAQVIICKLLTENLNNELNSLNFNCIIPVPVHRMRNIKRGFNQSQQLAKSLSSKLNIPVDPFYAKRIKKTKPQTLLKGKERNANVTNAFEIVSNKTYESVLVVDDIFTTGSTLKSFCHTLQLTGVREIYTITFARRIY